MKHSYLMAVILLSVLHCTAVWAQEIQVNGKVTTADDNVSLPGVSIMVKGTNIGTSTDADGNYSLNVPDGNSTLVFLLSDLSTLKLRSIIAQRLI